MLCPGPPQASLQVIDARDQAAWAVGLVERGVAGAFHACSPTRPWSLSDLVQAAAAALGGALDGALDPVWVPAEQLAGLGVDGSVFPLWSEGADEGAMAMDPGAATGTGLSPRPIQQTIRETYAWMQEHPWQRDGVGLSATREAELFRTLAPGG